MIADFGIARAIDMSANERVTMAGIAVGTPAYISPEQAAGDTQADGRADIYSLGCVLYELLAGRPPFTGPSVQAIIAKRFLERPKPLVAFRPDVPPPIARAVMRALERDAAERFANAAQFVAALTHSGSTATEGSLSVYTHGTSRPEASIAVLPFVNSGSDAESEYFADGMTEEIINALSQIPKLRVPARTSSFAFKRSTEDVRVVGAKLGVSSVLEGSVRRMGNRLRVTAQLINVKDGFHLWSERYDREMKDVFEIQDEISAAIVNTVKGKLVVTGEHALVRQGTANMEAYHSYLRGRHHWYRRELKQAIACFEQAVAQDPRYALPYCGLADTYSAFGLYGIIPTAVAHQRAKAMVDRAMEADDSLADVQYSRGLIEFFFTWRLDEAVSAFREAIRRNPRMATANANLCAVSGMMGDEVTTLESGPRAQELEPLSPLVSATASMGYFLLSRLELTELACQQAVAIDPGQNTADYLLALSHAGQGRYDEALARLEGTAARMQRVPHILMFLGEVLWKSGRHDAARAVVTEMKEKCAAGVDRPAALAWLHMHMGELDAGFKQLDLGIAQQDPAVPFLLSWPGLGPMRADARYDEVLDRLSLSRYGPVWHKRSG